jgi:hypothetical protein
MSLPDFIELTAARGGWPERLALPPAEAKAPPGELKALRPRSRLPTQVRL